MSAKQTQTRLNAVLFAGKAFRERQAAEEAEAAEAAGEATDSYFDDRLVSRLTHNNRHLNYYSTDYDERRTERENNEVEIETWYLNLAAPT